MSREKKMVGSHLFAALAGRSDRVEEASKMDGEDSEVCQDFYWQYPTFRLFQVTNRASRWAGCHCVVLDYDYEDVKRSKADDSRRDTVKLAMVSSADSTRWFYLADSNTVWMPHQDIKMVDTDDLRISVEEAA